MVGELEDWAQRSRDDRGFIAGGRWHQDEADS